MFPKSTVVVLVLSLFGAAGPSHGATAVHRPAEPPPQSLRGVDIDLDDAWTSARLLAHFGETRLAYDVLRDRPDSLALDPWVSRFEARLLVELGLVERADSVLALQSMRTGGLQQYTLCLWRARLNLLAGQHDRALWFLSLLDTLSAPAFEPYKDYLTLECLIKAERLDEACAVGEARLAEGVPLSLSPQFEEHLLEAYMASDKHDKALRFIDVLKARRNRSPAIVPVLLKEVDLLFVVGDTSRAIARGVELVRDDRTGAHAAALIESITDRVDVGKIAESQLLVFLQALLEAENLAGAHRLTSALAARTLSSQQKDELTLLTADLYFKEKRYGKSLNLVQREFSDPSLERKATLLRARIARRTGRSEQSAIAYVTFATRYPYDAKAAEALLVAAEVYFDLGNKRRFMELLQLISKTYPSSRHARTATMKMATYRFDQREFAEGNRILAAAVARSNRRDEELLYYLADGHRRAGDQAAADKVMDELRALDPVSFYLDPAVEATFSKPLTASNGRVELRGEHGLLEFLVRMYRTRLQSYERVRAVLDAMPKATARLEASELYLERGGEFLQMGFRDWAEYELKILESNYRLPARYSFELGILYDDFAMHWRSVRAFQGVYYALSPSTRAPLENDFKLFLHPLPYPALILENCAMGGMAPHLVYAMMRQESQFDQNAVSIAGAMGLMQLMPSTGEHVAGQLGFPRGAYASLLVPEINVTFGIWYAAHLLHRTRGDVLMMLSAYNAGLGNAKRWFNGTHARGAAAIAAVDGIDFSETRSYVKRIVESAHVYHAFYFDGPLDPMPSDP
jgi:soluble lytic murein transglycosylase